MDRRHFLKRSVVSAAGIATTGVVATEASAKTVKVKTRLEYGQTIKEPSRRIPVVDSADLIVVGGGPAGFAASVAAARQGLDVIMLERGYFLGGLFHGMRCNPAQQYVLSHTQREGTGCVRNL